MTIYFSHGSETASLQTDDLRAALQETFAKLSDVQKVLLLPPDQTRLFSRAGELTSLCHELLGDRVTDIMPALGTHSAMKPDQLDHMFPGCLMIYSESTGGATMSCSSARFPLRL